MEQGLISRQLSADASCGPDHLMDHKFEYTAEGFVPTTYLFDAHSDTNGYVGYLPSDKSIYVVFRGSLSLDNWLTDFNGVLANYDKSPECKCNVHAGF